MKSNIWSKHEGDFDVSYKLMNDIWGYRMDSSNQTPVPVYEFDDMHMQPFDYRPDEAKDLDPRIGPQTREAPPYTMPPGNARHRYHYHYRHCIY